MKYFITVTILKLLNLWICIFSSSHEK